MVKVPVTVWPLLATLLDGIGTALGALAKFCALGAAKCCERAGQG